MSGEEFVQSRDRKERQRLLSSAPAGSQSGTDLIDWADPSTPLQNYDFTHLNANQGLDIDGDPFLLPFAMWHMIADMASSGAESLFVCRRRSEGCSSSHSADTLG